jgi:cyanophycinase
MTGTVALQGGGAFTANDDLDRQLLASVGATQVAVLPTADAFEHPERLIAAADEWGARLGVEVVGLMVLRRADAGVASVAQTLRAATAIYLVGDQPLHLRSVLKETPAWEAILDVYRRGGLIVGCAGSAAGLCDPMVDPRGGAFTLGLGLVNDLAVVTQSETWSHDRLHRTMALANTAVATLPTGSALVRADHVWQQVGAVEVHGDLPS